MSFLCLWSPGWQKHHAATNPDRPVVVAHPEIAATLLARAPRIAIGTLGEHSLIWADAHGFSTPGRAALANDLIAILARRGISDARVGIASTPIAAALAAVHGGSRAVAARQVHTDAIAAGAVTIVPPGTDRAYVGLFPLSVLDMEPRLRPLLFGIGVSTCRALAALDRESVEVRLGAAAVPLWKFARADDPRMIFSPAPPEAPHASLEWVEYALRDPMRLLFVLNSLIDRVCTTLAATGEGAHEFTIELALTNRQVHVEMIRASRPTANRRTWIRLTRTRIACVRLSAAVTGITLHASKVAPREAPQGDLFDKGLASSEATEDAVARLIDDQGDVVVAPQNSAHPLLDERTTWAPQKPGEVMTSVYTTDPTTRVGSPELLMQLAPSPLAIAVETIPRRDHFVPVRFCDEEGWHDIVHAAGPERVSGRSWDGDHAYAREYFRCVTKEGVLVWLYRDAHERSVPGKLSPDRVRDRKNTPSSGRWYLHGWWD